MSVARPAWAKDSMVLRLPAPGTPEELTPEWAYAGSTGAGVRVAVIDSGIDADHPRLGDAVDREDGIDFSIDPDGEVVATPGPHGDVFGHGTACAGIIHALAPEARITSVRVLGPGLTGKAAAFHAGLAWAVDQGFDVINLSLGTTKADWALAFYEVCDRAYFGSSFVVTAANNVRRASYPSLFASVASVACNTSADPLRFHVNPEPPTEFLARGIDVEVPWLGGGTTTITGNSFAAPHIAGLAALVKGKHPELRPFQVKAVLWATAANVREAGVAEIAGRRGTVHVTQHRGTVARPPAPPGGTTAYEVGDVVRRTRSGPVRRGRRRADGQLVAVHDLRDLLGADAQGRRRLRHDLDTLARLGHPHLAAPIELVDEPGPLVVVPWGEPLDVRARPLAEAGALGLEFLDALAAAHGVGLLHGDLRIDALVVTHEGRLLVTGAGLTAALVAAGRADVGVPDPGLLGWVAPEVLGGGEATVAADVFGAGLVVATLVLGRSPLPEATTLGALLRTRVSAPVPSIGEVDPTVPPELVTVLDRALRRDPSERQPGVDALAQELGTALEHSGTLGYGRAAGT